MNLRLCCSSTIHMHVDTVQYYDTGDILVQPIYQCTYNGVQNQKGTTSKTTTLGFVLNIYFISGCCITFYKLHDIYAKELGNQSDIGQVHLRPIVLFSDNSFA